MYISVWLKMYIYIRTNHYYLLVQLCHKCYRKVPMHTTWRVHFLKALWILQFTNCEIGEMSDKQRSKKFWKQMIKINWIWVYTRKWNILFYQFFPFFRSNGDGLFSLFFSLSLKVVFFSFYGINFLFFSVDLVQRPVADN